MAAGRRGGIGRRAGLPRWWCRWASPPSARWRRRKRTKKMRICSEGRKTRMGCSRLIRNCQNVRIRVFLSVVRAGWKMKRMSSISAACSSCGGGRASFQRRRRCLSCCCCCCWGCPCPCAASRCCRRRRRCCCCCCRGVLARRNLGRSARGLENNILN